MELIKEVDATSEKKSREQPSHITSLVLVKRLYSEWVGLIPTVGVAIGQLLNLTWNWYGLIRSCNIYWILENYVQNSLNFRSMCMITGVRESFAEPTGSAPQWGFSFIMSTFIDTLYLLIKTTLSVLDTGFSRVFNPKKKKQLILIFDWN